MAHLNATDYTMMLDEIHFTNIISNLLDNAIKYSPENPDIIISTRTESSHLIIGISDKGIGMSKDAQKRNEVLFAYLQRYVDHYAKEDDRCFLIPPDVAKVRHSTALQYWGYHIIEKTTPQLAFKMVAGKSYPRSDFLQLADYLESAADLTTLH